MNLFTQEPALDTSYRLIPLTQGQFALVDAADFDWLNQWKWNAHWSTFTRSFYARRTARRSDGSRYEIAMHHEILGLNFGDKRQVDHIHARNTLDNRRGNLRIATAAQNQHNTSRRRDNKSGYKGVFRYSQTRWTATIQVNKKQKCLGYFPTAEAAYAAYCSAAKALHGEFAHLG